MASLADIAALMTAGMAPPAGNSDIGFHQGVIQSWDDLSGVNTVLVNSSSIPNVRVINSGLGVSYTAGDVVGLLRFQTTYFIMGRIAAAGASAAQQVVSQQIDTYETTTNTGWVDLATPGPTVSAFIGSTRRCLVLVTATISASGGSTPVYQGGAAGFTVSGASSISADLSRAARAIQAVTSTSGVGFTQTHSMTKLLTASDGLNAGFNTFTSKYTMEPGATVAVGFRYRNLTVIPL